MGSKSTKSKSWGWFLKLDRSFWQVPSLDEHQWDDEHVVFLPSCYLTNPSLWSLKSWNNTSNHVISDDFCIFSCVYQWGYLVTPKSISRTFHLSISFAISALLRQLFRRRRCGCSKPSFVRNFFTKHNKPKKSRIFIPNNSPWRLQSCQRNQWQSCQNFGVTDLKNLIKSPFGSVWTDIFFLKSFCNISDLQDSKVLTQSLCPSCG